MARTQRLFSVTICAKRKPGMEEDKYHRYISETHAPLLKRLLVEKKIVDYTMQHNTSALMKDLPKLYPNLPAVNRSPYDALVTIVFRDPQDYIDVKNDPHFVNVVNPDHKNFSRPEGTHMAYGWFEKHVSEGKMVEEDPDVQEVIANGH